MQNINPQYLLDAKGRKSQVVLTVREYKRLVAELEDLRDCKAMDAVAHERRYSLESVIREREARKKR